MFSLHRRTTLAYLGSRPALYTGLTQAQGDELSPLQARFSETPTHTPAA